MSQGGRYVVEHLTKSASRFGPSKESARREPALTICPRRHLADHQIACPSARKNLRRTRVGHCFQSCTISWSYGVPATRRHDRPPIVVGRAAVVRIPHHHTGAGHHDLMAAPVGSAAFGRSVEGDARRLVEAAESWRVEPSPCPGAGCLVVAVLCILPGSSRRWHRAAAVPWRDW